MSDLIEKENPKPWFKKLWLMILLLLLFTPVGVLGIWKNESIAKMWKKSALVLLILFYLLSFLNKFYS